MCVLGIGGGGGYLGTWTSNKILHTAAYQTDILHNVNIGRHFYISYEQISIGIIKSHNIMVNIHGKLLQ